MKVSKNIKLAITTLSTIFFGGLSMYCLGMGKIEHAMGLLLVMVFVDMILDRFLLDSSYTGGKS